METPRYTYLPMKLVVLDGFCLNPGDLSWDELRELGDVEVYDRTPIGEVVSRLADVDYAITNKTPISAAAIDQLPKLRFISVFATGYDVVDVAAAKRRGIPVTNVPTYGTASRNMPSRCFSNSVTTPACTRRQCAAANGPPVPTGHSGKPPQSNWMAR
jgi:hypothetical protein